MKPKVKLITKNYLEKQLVEPLSIDAYRLAESYSGLYAVCVDSSTHQRIKKFLELELEAINSYKIVGESLD